MIRFAAFVQAVFLLLAAAPLLSAAEPGPDELIQQALDLRRDGKPEEALQLFQRAHAIAPSPRTFGQMGLVEASLERWVDADLHLSVSLANPDDPWIRKNRAFLEQALATSKLHIGDLVVSGPPGVEVFVGGKSVGTLPAVPALRLAEGTASVSATAAGFKPFDEVVVIRPGTRVPIVIALSPIALQPATTASTTAAPPSIAARPSDAPVVRSRWHTWVGSALAGIGAGVLAWGVVWIAVDGGDDCATTHGSACGTAYNTKTPGWILAGAGAAAIVTGGIVFLTGRHAESPTVAVGLAPSSFVLQAHF